MERIRCAAIAYKGKIYTGFNHCSIGLKMWQDNVCPRPYPGGKYQGFVTESGVFVSRERAMQIALAAGQVEAGTTQNDEELYSEDLNYPELNTRWQKRHGKEKPA